MIFSRKQEIYDLHGNDMRFASVVEMYSIPIVFQYILKVTCVRKSENTYFH